MADIHIDDSIAERLYAFASQHQLSVSEAVTVLLDRCQTLSLCERRSQIHQLETHFELQNQDLVMTNERLQQEIEERKQAQEVATRFVSMLSHEFRNPLAAIQSSAELLKKYGGRMTDERKCEHMDKIQVQVKQIVDLLDTILSVNANGNAALKFHPTPVDMPQFCAEILEEMELIHGGTHTLILNIDDQCHALLLDRWWLRHLLNNLLSNAIKYSPGGGAVYLNVMCRENTVMLCVRDEGMGIPKADYTRLFQRFQRGSNVGSIPGTGLGLSMVLQAVEAHGGSIDVESEIGQGSTFTVVLPAQQLETAPR